MNKDDKLGVLIGSAKYHIAIAKGFEDKDKRNYHLMRAKIYLDGATAVLEGVPVITSVQRRSDETGLEWLGI
jgi:hypothetical protein